MLGKLASQREQEILDALCELETPTSWNILYRKLGRTNFQGYQTALNDLVLQGFVNRDNTIWRTSDAGIYSLPLKPDVDDDCEYRASLDDRMPSRH